MTWRHAKRGPAVPEVARHALAAVACIAAGAGVVYLLNPSNGLRRRRAKDRLTSAQVSSAIGGSVSRPTAVRACVSGGTLTLRGEVPLTEVDALLRAVYAVDGVRDITNRLHETPTPAMNSGGATGREVEPQRDGGRRAPEYVMT